MATGVMCLKKDHLALKPTMGNCSAAQAIDVGELVLAAQRGDLATVQMYAGEWQPRACEKSGRAASRGETPGVWLHSLHPNVARCWLNRRDAGRY
jgi:hypothetical protein